MYTGILHTHYLVVTLFLIIYFIKTILLISNKQDALKKISKALRVPEMIISFLFLGTGIYLLTKVPEINSLMIIKISLVFLSIPLAIIGFKKGNKLLAALSFFMLVASFGIAEAYHKKMTKGAAEIKVEGGNFDAKKFYAENCTRCHGDNGKAMIMGAFDLSASTLDKQSVASVIVNGRGMMGGYKNLTPQEADAVADYVLTLRGK